MVNRKQSTNCKGQQATTVILKVILDDLCFAVKEMR